MSRTSREVPWVDNLLEPIVRRTGKGTWSDAVHGELNKALGIFYDHADVENAKCS